MLIALPEIDGATNPTVFAGRHGADGCTGCAHALQRHLATRAPWRPAPNGSRRWPTRSRAWPPCAAPQVAERKVGIVLYGFPPNAGAVGTAAYLGVFESLHNTLHAMAAEGYDLTPPATVDDLREAVLQGNAAPVRPARQRRGPCPGRRDRAPRPPGWPRSRRSGAPPPARAQSDGRGVFVLGRQFGNVFVGMQPVFGYEGDPMRLLFERGFAPTHAFTTFYRWLREDFGADALLHFGMHGALEFMPGKQAGMGARLLARPADRRSAQHLPLCRQQPVRGDAGQAPLERDHRHPPDAAAGAGRASTRACWT